MPFARCLAVVILSVLLAGCTLLFPRDVELVSVTAIDSFGEAELHLHESFGYGLDEVMDSEGIKKFERSLYGGSGKAPRPREHELMFKVELLTSHDLAMRSADGGHYPWVKGGLCDHPDTADTYLSELYWGGHIAGFYYDEAARNARALGKPDFTYYFYFRASPREVAPAYPPTHFIDHNKKPEDICFQVDASGYGVSEVSNIVKIPKAAIAAALRDLPPAF